jgi:hypothetical protein
MSVHKLIFEDNEAVELIALRSSDLPYKVVWRLNKALNVKLSKVGDYELNRELNQIAVTGLFQAEFKEPSFEVFSLGKEEAESEALVLVSNKDEGILLFKEAKGFDMVLFMSSQRFDYDHMQDLLDSLEETMVTKRISCLSYSKFNTPFNYFDL